VESARETALFSGVCLFNGTLVVIQLWLLSAAIDALLAGDATVPVAAAVASLVLFAGSGLLLLRALPPSRS
jgi:hypothetical protein